MTDTVENMPRWRLLVLALLVVGALWTLIARLHTLQVKQSDDFESSQIRQSVRRVLLPAPRGRIFDRNGLCLADNRPSYCIAVYAEELRKRIEGTQQNLRGRSLCRPAFGGPGAGGHAGRIAELRREVLRRREAQHGGNLGDRTIAPR